MSMKMLECNLPPYLAHDLEAWKKGVEEKSAAEKPTALSYTNSCLSEHIASTIANMIGFRAHETRLGTFTNGRTKIVYVDFFKRHGSDILSPSLARIAQRIDLPAICSFIDDVPFLTELQRNFYKVYLSARYEALTTSQSHSKLHRSNLNEFMV